MCVSVASRYINSVPSIQAWRWIIHIFAVFRESCISFSMTYYKRCNSLLNWEAVFTKRFYPIYYNMIPYLLGMNVGKTKKANSWLNFPKLMAR